MIDDGTMKFTLTWNPQTHKASERCRHRYSKGGRCMNKAPKNGWCDVHEADVKPENRKDTR